MITTFLYICIAVLFSLRTCYVERLFNAAEIDKVVDSLRNKYHKEIIPIKNNTPVEVKVNLFINDMVPLENADMHFSIDCYFRMEWSDYRLAFNWSEPDSFIPFDHEYAQKIWKPNIYFPLGKKGTIHNYLLPNVLLNIFGDGRVRYSVRLSILSYCNMNLMFYPFDIQDCEVKIETYAYNNDYVKLAWMVPPVERSGADLNIADYNKVTFKNSDEKHYGGDFNQTFDTLLLTVTLDRDFALYFLRDFFPCVMIVVLSWVAFWINYKSTPARVALGITTVLTIVTMTNSIRATAPEARSFRSLDYYMMLCILFVISAMGVYALVGMSDPKSKRKWLQEKKKKERKMEKVAKVSDGMNTSHFDFGPTFCQRFPADDSYEESFQSKSRRSLNIPGKPLVRQQVEENEDKIWFLGPFVFYDDEKHIIDNVAKLLFPLLFLILNAIYFLFHRFHPDTVN